MTIPGPLRIDSDISFTVTGAAEPVTGRVDAAGSRVRISTSDVGATVAAARSGGVVSPRRLGAVGAGLAGAGVTVEFAGPRGPVLSVGAGIDSPVGALLSGSPYLRLHSLRGAAALARGYLPPASRIRRAGRAVGALAVPILIVAIRRRRTGAR